MVRKTSVTDLTEVFDREAGRLVSYHEAALSTWRANFILL